MHAKHRPVSRGHPSRAGWYQELVARAAHLPRLRTAVVQPLDANALIDAAGTALAGLMEPVLIGPQPAILAVAEMHGVDVTAYAMVPTGEADAPAVAAARAATMARGGEIGAIMKGSLRTDELMHAVVAPEAGLSASSGRSLTRS